MAIETYFKNIADAIREKAGTSGLITPAQMPQAIADIPSGGGSIDFLTPIANNLNNGYVSGGIFYYTGTSDPDIRVDVYQLETGQKYIAVLGSTVGNRFRVTNLPTNPVNATSDIVGASISEINDPSTFTGCWFNATWAYLAIQKSNQGVNNIPSYVIKVADLVGE